MGSPDVRTLTRSGVVWRTVLTVAALGGLAYGSIAGSNRDFPFGPMTQYAFYVAPNGVVKSTTVWADTTAGTHVHVVLGGHGVGIKRADVEDQLSAILADPSKLRPIATAQQRLHPDQPQYVKLYVVQRIYPLHNREPGPSYGKVLTTWTVTP